MLSQILNARGHFGLPMFAPIANNIIAHNEGGTFIDFKLVGGKYVKNPIPLKNPPAGGVVLQHDVHEASSLATDLFIQYAKDHGIHLPRIDEVEEFKITKNNCPWTVVW